MAFLPCISTTDEESYRSNLTARVACPRPAPEPGCTAAPPRLGPLAAQHCRRDLQPELVGLVLGRLPLADRVRLGAALRHEPLPPPLPWLTLLDCTFLSIVPAAAGGGGEVHSIRMPLPKDYCCCHGSVGNWLFFMHLGREFSLMNPFSKDALAVRLPKEAYPPGRLTSAKPPLLSSTPQEDLSPDSLFAILITTSGDEFGSFDDQSVISLSRTLTASAFRMPEGEHVSDIAFVDGKLYALSLKKLFVLEIDSAYKGRPRALPMKCVANAVDNPGLLRRSVDGKNHVCAYWSYHAESGGNCCTDRMDNSRTLSFEAFELAKSSDRWTRVNTLGGQALFVGTISKSLLAPECGAQEDCIYFVCDYDNGNRRVDPLRDSGVFDLTNGMITPLIKDTAVVRPAQARGGCVAWFFPTKVA
ncbi:hypothetical protein BS78_K091100 [Paspalum vaginatum]|uniref:KIB1-4 beta-propeller domain-containing protein n=1 Tax=Paspalum vaginatum TaxID=158149 RepID=A0A9W8CDM2_9POAL|nr:hypothetical protein BS78_K091100 [Paspalum vaginatum]